MLQRITIRRSAPRRPATRRALSAALACLLSAGGGAFGAHPAQKAERELAASEGAEITIRNLAGRVQVVASEEQGKKVSVLAESAGAATIEDDVRTASRDGRIEIEVSAPAVDADGGDNQQGRGGRGRIDLTVRVPVRARVSVRTGAGAVDLVGPVASADVETDTGTIRADVPLDSLKYNFQWRSSRPRYFSEVELGEVKERRGQGYEISGRFGDKKAKRTERIELNLVTERGVVLFGVSDPSMVPPDLRERKLTEGARAIIRSGDEDLTEAIRKVVPRLVGDYTKTLPPSKGIAPSLVPRRGTAEITTAAGHNGLARLNASVTDLHGRAIGGLTEKDFTVIENGRERAVREVTPAAAPFNLVLLLDVSGSVEERLDFIRKAALAFLNTTGPQDRIAIVSFRDDVQLISDFTADRTLLSTRIKKIEAGGGTALYDSLAYVLVNTLRPLHGERTAVVILSDGDDNKSFLPFPEVLEAAIESGALVYPLYIPSGLIPARSVPSPEQTIDPMRSRFLTLSSRAGEEGRKLAEVSGGVYYPLTHFDQLQRAYNDVVAQLRTAYTITYESGSADRPAGEARVRVRVRAEGASVRLSPSVAVPAGEPVGMRTPR